MIDTDRPTLSVAETAELLGISRWLVQQAVHDGSLPSVRVGRRILIPTERLRAWLSGADRPEPDTTQKVDGPLQTRPVGRADRHAS